MAPWQVLVNSRGWGNSALRLNVSSAPRDLCSEGLCIWETPNMTNTKEASANGREFTGAQETVCPWCVYQFSVS